MTVALPPIEVGPARPAVERGGDVRLRDLHQGRDVRGPHVFAGSASIRMTNGLLRLDVSGPGGVPSVGISVRRGAVVIGDFLSDILSDTLPGSNNPPEWLFLGTLSFDSTSVATTLTRARIVRLSREVATVRLVAAAVGDIYLTLRRGELMGRAQHGTGRGMPQSVVRRIRWTASPTLTGTASTGRVSESTSAYTGAYRGVQRFLVARQTVTASGSAFSLTTTTARVIADFGFGVATPARLNGVADQHGQFLGVTKTKLRLAG